MRLHLSGTIYTDGRARREHRQDLMYTALFVIGAPAVAMGAIYLVDTLFNLLWR